MPLRRFRRSERGAAAVEFAVVAPVLLLFIFAIIDFGRFLATHNRLVSAVREGARAGAATVAPGTYANINAAITGRAQTKVVNYLTNAGVRQSNGSAVTAAQVVVETPTVANNQSVIVYLNVGGVGGYQYTPITPFANRIGLNGIVLRPVAVFRHELAD
jgi:Flp pilus assembly protein TadG